MALSPRALLVGGWVGGGGGGGGEPSPLIRARHARRQLLAFTIATILEYYALC